MPRYNRCMYMAHLCFKLTVYLCMVSVCCIYFVSLDVVISLNCTIGSAFNFNFEQLRIRYPMRGKNESECSNSGYKLTGLTWRHANSRFLGLVSVGAARNGNVHIQRSSCKNNMTSLRSKKGDRCGKNDIKQHHVLCNELYYYAWNNGL